MSAVKMSKDITKWIQEQLVPRIIQKDGWESAKLIKCEVQDIPSMKDNWASDMYEINLLLEDNGENKPLSLILKVMLTDMQLDVQIHSEKQFSNEIHFYSKVVPMLSSQASNLKIRSEFELLFPKCYCTFFCQNKSPITFEDVSLVMENLKVYDYKLGNRTILDMDHCTLALKRLGFFHAFSYIMKKLDPNTFRTSIVKPIQESYFVLITKDITNRIFNVLQNRVIDAIAAEAPLDDLRLVRLRELASRNACDVLMDAFQPSEPFSVLCHGDFLRNNILFRYENGIPVDTKFLDFQMIRYASPAIDVALLICFNTTHELRKSYFDELLRVYHSSLTETMASLLGTTTDKLEACFGFDAFFADFKTRAVYGYMVALDFLGRMYANENELAEIVKLHEDRGSPRFIEVLQNMGGDRVRRLLVDLASDLIYKNWL